MPSRSGCADPARSTRPLRRLLPARQQVGAGAALQRNRARRQGPGNSPRLAGGDGVDRAGIEGGAMGSTVSLTTFLEIHARHFRPY